MLIKQQSLISENHFISSPNEALEETHSTQKNKFETFTSSNKNSHNELFPEQQIEDKQIKRIKLILGDLGAQLSNEQLRDIASEVQFLIYSWLDDFERNIFDGVTLQELLHEKGSR